MSSPTTTDTLLTITDVMLRLGVSQPDTILRLIRSGQLKASNISARPIGRATWRIAERDLAAFLESRVPPPAPPTMRRRRKPNTGSVPQYV